MSHEYYMNMEKITMKIIDGHLKLMTDNNYQDDIDCFLDDAFLINNIENGFIVISQLNCYFESFLNTIISGCIQYKGENILKCSIDEKLEIIFMHYDKDIQIIKSKNEWAMYKRTAKVRNSMIHYKKSHLGMGLGIPEFKLGGMSVGSFFTISNLMHMKQQHVQLAYAIAEELDLGINESIRIFANGAKDGLVNYVYDKKTL